MRKFIAILIILLVTGGFYLSIKRMQPIKPDTNASESVLETIEKRIDTKYPSDPVEVIEVHNILMGELYGKELTQEEIGKLVRLQRALYEEGFLELTPIDEQLEEINQELLINKERGLKIISSKIIGSYEEPPGVVNVEVTHYTKQADINRNYILEKELEEGSEKEKWKILGWTNIQEE